MTVVRAPGSIEQALDRISGIIPWVEMAVIVDRDVSTVRNWSLPHTRESIPITLAVKLDLAWQREGQLGAPLLNAYMALVDAAREEEVGCQVELTRNLAAFAKETGEAVEATALGTLPDADDGVLANADRQLNDVDVQVSIMRSLIRRIRRTRTLSKPP